MEIVCVYVSVRMTETKNISKPHSETRDKSTNENWQFPEARDFYTAFSYEYQINIGKQRWNKLRGISLWIWKLWT